MLDRWRREIAAGTRVGPRLVLVGPTINGPGDDSYHLEASSFEGGVQAADSVARLGVDLVKVHRLLPADAFRGVIEAAARHGLRVVGHVPYGISALDACDSGMAEIAHMSALLEAAIMRDERPAAGIAEGVGELTSDEGRAVYECLATHGGALTPNLVAYAHLARTADAGGAELTWRLIDALGGAVETSGQMGVPLLVGSDAPGENGEIPWGISVHEELALLVQAGLRPIEALVAASAAAAAFMGSFDDVGSVDEGKRADLVLLRSNPLDDIAATRDIAWIVRAGRLVRPSVDQSRLPAFAP